MRQGEGKNDCIIYKICETNLGTPITLEELGQVLKKKLKMEKIQGLMVYLLTF